MGYEERLERATAFRKRLVVAFAGAFLLAGSALAQPRPGGVLRIATPHAPINLDSRTNMSGGGIIIANQVQEGLLTTDLATGEALPALAESWEVSGDGLTYTFYLRRGVKFHDGTDFTAADVVYTFDFITGARPGGDYVSQFAPQIANYEATDDFTFVVTLTTPWEDFLTSVHRAWVFKILSQEAVESAGEAYGADVMVGTGPFRFVEWARGERIVLERNPDYWGASLPYLDGVEYRLILDATVRLVNLISGAVDVVYEPPLDQALSRASDSSFDLVAVPGNPLISVQFNTRVVPFNDARVRRALYLALDRGAIVEARYSGFADVATDLVPAWHWLYDASHEGVPYDPALARELLAQSGYSESSPLAFELMVTPASIDQELAVILQAQWAAVGVKASIRTIESATRTALIAGRDGQDPNQYKAALWQQNLSGSTTDEYIQKFYAAEGTLNRMFVNQAGGYADPELEQLISSARSAPVREDSRTYYRLAIDLLEDSVPLIPIAYLQNVTAVASSVRNYTPIGTHSFAITAVWIDR